MRPENAIVEMLVQAAEEALAFREHSFASHQTARTCLQEPVLARVLRQVLLVEDVVPRRKSASHMVQRGGAGLALPSVCEVQNQAANYRTRQADADVGPPHSGILGAVNCYIRQLRSEPHQ